jgi:hypothetical protein
MVLQPEHKVAQQLHEHAAALALICNAMTLQNFSSPPKPARVATKQTQHLLIVVVGSPCLPSHG